MGLAVWVKGREERLGLRENEEKRRKKNEGKEEEIGVKREACERENETCFIKQILFFFTILLQWTASLLDCQINRI